MGHYYQPLPTFLLQECQSPLATLKANPSQERGHLKTNLNLNLEPDMKLLRRTLPFLCLIILGALGADEVEAQPNGQDIRCVARSQRILGEYGECLSKVNSRAIRTAPEALFDEDQGALRGDAACVSKFDSRMDFFGDLYANRGAGEICACATGLEARFFLGFFNYFLWGRSCEQFASHIVDGTLAIPESIFAKPKAGCAARSKETDLTVEDLCGDCGILNGGFGPGFPGGFDGPGGFLSIIGPGCSGP